MERTYPFEGMRRLCAVLILMLAVGCASSGQSSVAKRAQRIEGQVWSPYCPGKLLIDCTTTQAGQLRARIKRQLRAGRSDAAVLADIRHDFGDSQLARPPSGGTGVVVWMIPVAIFVLGAGVVIFVRRRRTEIGAPPSPAAPSDALETLRDEVRRNI